MSEKKLYKPFREAIEAEMSGGVLLKHSDGMTAGHPDFSHTWLGSTIWLEIKWWDGGEIKSRSLQRLICERLERNGLCYFVVYTPARVFVVLPSQLRDLVEISFKDMIFPSWRGINHSAVAQFVRGVHEDREFNERA